MTWTVGGQNVDCRGKNSTFTWTVREKAWTIGEQHIARVAFIKGLRYVFVSTVIIRNNYSNGGMVATLR